LAYLWVLLSHIVDDVTIPNNENPKKTIIIFYIHKISKNSINGGGGVF
jgi:hypothetical protein